MIMNQLDILNLQRKIDDTYTVLYLAKKGKLLTPDNMVYLASNDVQVPDKAGGVFRRISAGVCG